eukprot:GHRR01012798.1.p2 GENE.GHRR01012798.1~~GHRR01012798.1.p2  ORF type:complete len:114 (-),score=23.97 GHRR01012798.1:114-455(-)
MLSPSRTCKCQSSGVVIVIDCCVAAGVRLVQLWRFGSRQAAHNARMPPDNLPQQLFEWLGSILQCVNEGLAACNVLHCRCKRASSPWFTAQLALQKSADRMSTQAHLDAANKV